jgi:hypothetical protein
MRSSGSNVRVTSTPEDTKMIVARRGTEKNMVRSQSRGSSGGKTIEQVGDSVEALGPEARRQRGLDQKGAHDVVRGPNHVLSLAILERGIQTRHVQLDTSREEEGMRGVIVELTSIVTLNRLNGEAKLSRHPGKEV